MTIETIWNYRKQRSLTRRACRRLHWKLTRWQWRYVVYGIPVPDDIKANNRTAARSAVALRLLLAPSVDCLSDRSSLLRILIEDAALTERTIGAVSWLVFLGAVAPLLSGLCPCGDPGIIYSRCNDVLKDFWRMNGSAEN